MQTVKTYEFTSKITGLKWQKVDATATIAQDPNSYRRVGALQRITQEKKFFSTSTKNAADHINIIDALQVQANRILGPPDC